MNKSKYPLNYIADSLIILLNISNSYSIVPYLLFFQYNRAINTGLIFVINIIFLNARFHGKLRFSNNILIKIYVIISIVNVISSALTSTGSFLTWLYLLANVSFFLILYNCFCEYRTKYKFENSFWLIIRGYIWLVVWCISGSLLLFFLMKLGLNPYQNEISNKMDLFEANYELFNTRHYYPYCLSILLDMPDEITKLPFFYERGKVCGLYHEPHIVTFMVFPALFFLLLYIKTQSKRICVLLIWIFVMLMTTSTVNIIAFLICIMLYLSYSRSGRVILVPLSVILFIIIVYIGLENTEFFFIIDKIQGGSMDYSLKTIQFAFTPQTLWGSNFLSTSFLLDSESHRRDVGYISFILNIFFLLVFVFKIIKSLRLEMINKILGLAVLYFFLHSFKVAMVSYSLSMLTFMIFVVSISSQRQALNEKN